MSRRAVATCLLASAVALLAASPAAARERSESQLTSIPVVLRLAALLSQQAPFKPGFTIDPAGPYELAVGTSEGAVVLVVLRGNPGRRAAVTEYVARGVQAPERIQATFGRLGSVSMRFRESRRRPWFGKPRRCRGGDRFVVRRGVFVGNLRFRGENGYLTVHVHRAAGAISSLAAKCRHRHPRGAHSSSLSEDSISGLLATERSGVDATTFAALSFQGERFFLAQREEDRGRMAVLRSAVVLGRGELPLNEAVTAGRFSPGAPFHGKGLYRAAPDGSTSWSGDLSVDFLGAARFPLVGPGFETVLEAGF